MPFVIYLEELRGSQFHPRAMKSTDGMSKISGYRSITISPSMYRTPRPSLLATFRAAAMKLGFMLMAV